MQDIILSRLDYDVRFIEIPDKLPQSEYQSYIESRIHVIFPGNNNQYTSIFRKIGDGEHIVIIIKKTILDQLDSPTPIIPALFALDILKKRNEIDTLNILFNDHIETLSLGSNILKTSRVSNIDNFQPNDGHWIIIGDTSVDFVDSEKIISTPKIRDEFRFKQKKKNLNNNWLHVYAKTIIFLILVCVILFQYNHMINKELDIQAKNLKEMQRLTGTRTEIESEIKELQTIDYSDKIDINRPYELMEELFTTIGPNIRIQRISIQNNEFTINGIVDDPINISNILSNHYSFSEINIQRIQQEDDGFHLTLAGRYDG